MKSYFFKSICLVVLISFLGCSNDSSEDLIEEQQLEVIESKNGIDASEVSRNWPNSVVVYVECPVGISSCWGDFTNLITVYASVPSTECPGMTKAWVDATEYAALYQAAPNGVNHVLREPFGVIPPARLTEFYISNCFPE